MEYFQEKKELHKNIKLYFFYHFFNVVNHSIRYKFIEDHYIFLKFKKNEIVGLITIVSAFAALVVSPLVGLFCDRYPGKRNILIKALVICYFLVDVLYYLCMRTKSLLYIVCVSTLLNVLDNACNVIAESMFIQSISKGKKSLIFSYQKIISTIASLIGSFICLLLFYFYNDSWDLKNILIIFQFSIVTVIPLVILSFYWDDQVPVKKEEMIIPVVDLSDMEIEREEEISAQGENQRCLCILREKHIPYIVFISHLHTLAGAGMVVKYFAFFLEKEYKMKPIELCMLHILIPLLVASFSYIAQLVSRFLGRAQVSFYCSIIGFIMLCLLPSVNTFTSVVTVHIIRTIFQNCAKALDRSIVYDYINVPKNTGKWIGIHSLCFLVWAQSAYIGGRMSDIDSYRILFQRSIIYYMVSILIFIPVLHLVPKEKKQ